MVAWKRTDDDGATDYLTVVQLDGRDDYYVQVTTGPSEGDDFVGLYDLDGDQVTSTGTWSVAKTVPLKVILAVESNFESGTSKLERAYALSAARENAACDAVDAVLQAHPMVRGFENVLKLVPEHVRADVAVIFGVTTG